MLNYLNETGSSRQNVQTFGGYDHRLRISAGSFYDMNNMTCDNYPAISTRKKRQTVDGKFENASGMQCVNGNVYFIASEHDDEDNKDRYYLYKNSTAVKTKELAAGVKKTAVMGAYIIIFPDKVRYNTLSGEFDELEILFDKSVSIALCDSLYQPFNGFEPNSESGVRNIRFIIAIDSDEAQIMTDYTADTARSNSLKEDINSVLERRGYTGEYIYFIVADAENKIMRAQTVENRFTFANKAETTSVGNSLMYDMRYDFLYIGIKDSESGKVTKWSRDIPYIRIRGNGIGKLFDRRDLINIDSNLPWMSAKQYFNGDRIIYKTDANEDSIYIQGVLSSEQYTFADGAILIKRNVPDMDLICEFNNRLCGCKFSDGDEPLNEIYVSKLGSPGNFTVGTGTSAGGFVVSCGLNGKFTGMTAYNGYLCIFKEQGAVLINSYFNSTIADIPGVAESSSDSLCRIGNYLIYLGADGVYMFNGSTATKISENFGEVMMYSGSAAVLGDKYYLNAYDEASSEKLTLRNDARAEAARQLESQGVTPSDPGYGSMLALSTLTIFLAKLAIWLKNAYSFFVYDTSSGLWTKEEHGKGITAINSDGKNIYSIDVDGDMSITTDNAYKMTWEGMTTTEEEDFDWFLETGEIGYTLPDNKYVTRLNIRVNLPQGSNMRIGIRYDGNGDYTNLYDVSGSGLKSVTLPIMPLKCETFALKAEGHGKCDILSAAATVKEGSDKFD